MPAVADQRQQARDAAKKARQMAAQLERAAGIRSDAERMADNRRVTRDLQPPPIKDRARREKAEADDALWLRTYLLGVFTFPFTTAQRHYIDTVGECLQYGVSKCIAA